MKKKEADSSEKKNTSRREVKRADSKKENVNQRKGLYYLLFKGGL
ncbi:MAG: hypothetical protein AAFN93_06625 [Bacteroidota bacterium]